MDLRVCEKFDKKPWQKLDRSTLPSKPGIYSLAHEIPGRQKRNNLQLNLYTGRTNNLKRRIQEHQRKKFKGYDKSALRVKFVLEPKQKKKEWEYMECQRKKGNYPLLNKKIGDGAPSRAKGRKRKAEDWYGKTDLQNAIFCYLVTAFF